MAVPVGAANLHPPVPPDGADVGEGIERCRNVPATGLPTVRTFFHEGMTIQPSHRSPGPLDAKYLKLAVAVDR